GRAQGRRRLPAEPPDPPRAPRAVLVVPPAAEGRALKRSPRLLLLGLGALALFVAARLLPVASWLGAFRDWTAGLGAVGGIVYAAVYVAAALLFVPGFVLTIGA